VARHGTFLHCHLAVHGCYKGCANVQQHSLRYQLGHLPAAMLYVPQRPVPVGSLEGTTWRCARCSHSCLGCLNKATWQLSQVAQLQGIVLHVAAAVDTYDCCAADTVAKNSLSGRLAVFRPYVNTG
jgi:hypothetical protein